MCRHFCRRGLTVGLLAGLFVFSAAGYCTEPNRSDAVAYFPSEPGTTWKYVGEGNEYASFTWQVMFLRGQRAQFSEDNGGTRMIRVYRVNPVAVCRTLSVPEVYDDGNLLNKPSAENAVILKAPLIIGNTWRDDRFLSEVVGVEEKVTAPAGTFEHVLKIKRTLLPKQQSENLIFEYYAIGTGLVMQEYITTDGYRVVSRLKSMNKVLR